ncbi:hypothetical protein Zmor_009891 [Zophobas morio]|uniref:Uncharacterized protein n=1 Tax=Zophobas morio TaxID=2755281 RepID=A0AA38MJ96_9CUCU|nr:hypothetical protein Zmor_009891 [Zophobas morio]
MSFRKKVRSLVNSIRKIFSFTAVTNTDQLWQEFQSQNVVMLWIVGPLFSGKKSLASYLTENSTLRLLRTESTQTTNHEPRKHIIKSTIYQLKQEIKNNFKFCSGFIVSDFPVKMSEILEFENSICKPSVVICIESTLDATLGRALVYDPAADLNEIRVQYVVENKFMEKILRKYSKENKARRIFSRYPIHEMHAKVVEVLETEFSCKFK